MTRPTQVLGAVALAMFLGSGAAAPQPPSSESMAPLWTVHIDEVSPDKAAEFERLNIAENKGVHAILSKHGQPIKPVYQHGATSRPVRVGTMAQSAATMSICVGGQSGGQRCQADD